MSDAIGSGTYVSGPQGSAVPLTREQRTARELFTTRARIDAVRDFCAEAIAHDEGKAGNGLTDRQWCAQSVLNILDGLIDEQLPLLRPIAER